MDRRGEPRIERKRTMRPESQAMRYCDLQRPERDALFKLIETLSAAVDARKALSAGGVRRPDASAVMGLEGQTAMNVLVSGTRGSGKTTLLLTAANAIHNPAWFLEDSKQPPDTAKAALGENIRRLSEQLVWLPVLDMQSLGKGANLLAHLLVRVRRALELDDETQPEGKARSGMPASVLEEGSEGYWDEIDKLVRSGALLWEEDAIETDPLKRVQQQVRAAEVVAGFRELFQRGVEDVIAFRARRLRPREATLLVLPIDNGDRSAHHAETILKLIRMVYSPSLLYVLAAGWQDLVVFLERSHREFVGATAQGPSAEREDVLAIARRQAAAAQREMLPPSQRTDVSCVSVREALQFQCDLSTGCTVGGQNDLEALLKKIPVDFEPETAGVQHLFDLLCIRFEDTNGFIDALKSSLSGDEAAPRMLSSKENPPADASAGQSTPYGLDSRAAQRALALPIRSLLDLWAAAYREAETASGAEASSNKEASSANGEGAVRIVEEMLRNAIAESDLPDWACRLLLERVIPQHSPEKNCLLDLRGNPLRWRPQFNVRNTIDFELRDGAGAPAGGQILRSRVVLHDFYGFELELHDIAGKSEPEELPPSVSGWLMLLYDLLVGHSNPRVMIDATTHFEQNPMLVETQHTAVLADQELVEIHLSWPLPNFDCFLDFDRLTRQWQAFLELVLPHGEQALCALRKDKPAVLVRLLLAAWADNVHSVALGPNVSRLGAAEPRRAWDWSDLRKVLRSDDGANPLDSDRVHEYEDAVCSRLATLYKALRNASERSTRTRAVRLWLEETFPLLLLPEYAVSARPFHLMGVDIGPKTRPEDLVRLMRANDDTPYKMWAERRHSLAWERRRQLRRMLEGTSTCRELFFTAGDGMEAMRAQRTSWVRASKNLFLESLETSFGRFPEEQLFRLRLEEGEPQPPHPTRPQPELRDGIVHRTESP